MAVAATYDLITTVTASGSSATLQATSISQAYTNLRCVLWGNTNASTTTSPSVQFNSSTAVYTIHTTGVTTGGAAYNGNVTVASNSSIIDCAGLNFNMPTASATRGVIIMDIPYYSSTTLGSKQFYIRYNAAPYMLMANGRYALTSAISTVSFILPSSSWRAGSTLSIYGILKA